MKVDQIDPPSKKKTIFKTPALLGHLVIISGTMQLMTYMNQKVNGGFNFEHLVE